MYNLVNLNKKKIIVTGASSGIGRQIALTISQLGGTVIAVARREEELKITLSQLEGEGHDYYVADLSDADTVAGFMKDVNDEHGVVDGMVYAAGIMGLRPFRLLTPAEIKRTFDINFFGFVESVRQLTKKGRCADNTHIVAISSVTSICGSEGNTGYGASKSAINGMVRGMAKELAVRGIRVNAVLPSAIATGVYVDYVENLPDKSELNEGLNKQQYLGLGTPQDVANLTAFLLSPASDFMTGLCIPVDGGFSTN